MLKTFVEQCLEDKRDPNEFWNFVDWEADQYQEKLEDAIGITDKEWQKIVGSDILDNGSGLFVFIKILEKYKKQEVDKSASSLMKRAKDLISKIKGTK